MQTDISEEQFLKGRPAQKKYLEQNVELSTAMYKALEIVGLPEEEILSHITQAMLTTFLIHTLCVESIGGPIKKAEWKESVKKMFDAAIDCFAEDPSHSWALE